MPAQNAERLAIARREMERDGLDALVCRLSEHVVLLGGYWPNTGLAVVALPREGEPALIVPRLERDAAADGWVADIRDFPTWRLGDPDPLASQVRLIRALGEERGWRGKRIGYDGSFERLAPSQLAGEPVTGALTPRLLAEALPGATLVDATDTLNRIRAIKTPHDLAMLRRANAVAGLGLAAFRAFVTPGRSEAEVAGQVEAAVLAQGTGYQGARAARAWAQVTAGLATQDNWYYPVSRDYRIQRGDLVVIELGVVVDGYWADLTRTVVAGTPSARQREIAEAQRAAYEACLAAIRPGARAVEVDAAGRAALARLGMADAFCHHTGHGIGFRYHEPIPWLHPDSSHTLAEGMVSSLEPGLYIAGYGGLRVEDNVAVTADGVEVLSPADRGIDLL